MSTNESVDILLGSCLIVRGNCEKMLGVKTEYKLNFGEHVKIFCSKANNKLRFLARATQSTSVRKKEIQMNSLFNSQFKYGPLI